MRKPRIGLIDPIEEVAYSRPLRRGARYVEDTELQAVLDDKGLEHAKAFGRRRYHGIAVAVMPQEVQSV
jgi:hypothetical protein